MRVCIVLVGLGVAGCLPIAPAHKTVSLPPLKVDVSVAGAEPSPALAVEVIQPVFWSAAKTFVDMVKDVPPGQRFQRASLAVSAAPGEPAGVIFAEQNRYVAVPAISLFGDPPETGRYHRLFLRIGSEDEVHRISIDGNRASIKTVSLSQARSMMPRVLESPEPRADTFDRKWAAWFDAQNDLYRSAPWKDSPRVRVVKLTRSSVLDYVSVELVP